MNYVDPTNYEPGDTIYTDDGQRHIVDYVLGNMIVCTDGTIEIIPLGFLNQERNTED